MRTPAARRRRADALAERVGASDPEALAHVYERHLPERRPLSSSHDHLAWPLAAARPLRVRSNFVKG